MKKILQYLAVIVFFIGVSLFFFRGIFLSPGAITGSDWGFPLTQIQLKQDLITSTWTNHNNILGARRSYITGIPVQLVLKLFASLGLSADFYSKFYLIFVFALAGTSMYSLAKFLKLKEIPSILAGLFYISSPIFFDYSIMGWIYILLAMGLMPFAVICFIQAVEKYWIKGAVLTGIIYAFSIISAQSSISFMIVFLILGFYLINDKKSFISYLRSLFIVVSIFLLLNSHWILGLLAFPDKSILGSELVKSGPSLGTVAHMRPLNIIRLFGSLFNYQYEKIIDTSPLSFISFLMPISAIVPLLLMINKRFIVTLWLIALIPILMYLLNQNRDIFLLIPMANIIRDFARFAALSTFAYALLSAFFFNYFKHTRLLIIFFILWLVSIFPWWRGDIYNWQPGGGCFDIKLRTKVIPQEYLEMEKTFSRKKLDHKALHLPLGAMIEFKDDAKFSGMCNGMADAFAAFSPIPGALGISDRSQGYTDWYSKRIVLDSLKDNLDTNITDIVKPTNVKYFIIRKNLMQNDNKAVRDISKKITQGELNNYIDGKKISIYSLKNNDFLPHVYTPQNIIAGGKTLDDLPKILSSPEYNVRSVIYFDNQIKDEIGSGILEKLPQDIKIAPVLEFKKINLTKYRIRVHGAKEMFPLVFSESFHDGWKVYLAKSESNSKIKSQSSKLGEYKIFDGNKEDQATKEELKSFIDSGFITALGNKKIDFVSKNFQDTIQNDNLSSGPIYETWFNKSLDEKNHLMVNGYANSWIIKPDTLCDNRNLCSINSDGTSDFEVIIEFLPQKFFYIGITISSLVLLCCIVYLLLR